MASSGFIHKFDYNGNFKCEYFPHTLDTSEIEIKNKKLINSDFVISNGDFSSFDDNLLTRKSLVYFHIPFPSTETKKNEVFAFFNNIDLKGYNFLVTSRLINRGRIEESIKSWSENYSSIVIPFDPSNTFSDIFITNF